MSTENGISRRAALVKLGLFLNGIVGVFLAVPIVRYLLSPVIREKKFGYESWLSLGGLEQFPAGQTRLATYKNPVVNAWDGETGDIACWVRNVDDQNFPGLCHQLRAPRMPGSLVSPVEPLHVSLPRRRLLPGRFAGLWTSRARIVPVSATKSKTENFSSRLAKCRLPVSPLQIRREGRRHAPDPKTRRLVRSAAAAWHADSRNCRASGSARDRKLVLCFRQRRAHVFHAPDCHRHTACADLRAFRGRGVEQPADPQSRHLSGLVHTSSARLGLEFHGRDCPDPHGAGLPLWSLQVSKRTDLDRWRPSLARDARHGLYRPGTAIRPGCLLGIRHRGIDRKPRPGDRALGCEPDARRPNHCRRNAFTILRAACFCRSRTTDCFCRRASAHGAETGNQ